MWCFLSLHPVTKSQTSLKVCTFWMLNFQVSSFKFEFWTLNFDIWILIFEFWYLNFELWIMNFESWTLNVEFWIILNLEVQYKVIVFKFCGELTLLVQRSTFTFGPIKKKKVYETEIFWKKSDSRLWAKEKTNITKMKIMKITRRNESLF